MGRTSNGWENVPQWSIILYNRNIRNTPNLSDDRISNINTDDDFILARTVETLLFQVVLQNENSTIKCEKKTTPISLKRIGPGDGQMKHGHRSPGTSAVARFHDSATQRRGTNNNITRLRPRLTIFNREYDTTISHKNPRLI